MPKLPLRPTSEFLHHAIITHPPGIKYDLSGSTPPNLFSPEELSIHSKLDYADRAESQARLTQQLGQLLKLDPEKTAINFSVSSTMAFTQALATVTTPGDTVVMEKPNYEPFVKTALFLNLKIKYFTRTGDAETDFQSLKKVASKSRVLLLTNPHFPMANIYSEQTLRQFAAKFKYAIIDEAFLPQFTQPTSKATQFTGSLPANTIITGSFAKSLGLGALRLGWIASPKTFSTAINQVGYHLHIEMPVPILLAGEKALAKWSQALERLDRIIAPNRVLIKSWADANPGRVSHNLESGHFAMIKVKSAKKITTQLIKDGIFVKDGNVIGLPNHIRIHWMADPQEYATVWATIQKYL